MSFGTQKTIVLTKDELKDLESYCALNKFNVDEIIKSSFKQGFSIEKYGLLENMGGIQEKRVEIEVIREKRVEIPVEVIKEVVKIEYVEVPVEKIVEVIKEVIVEKEVIKEIIKEVPVEKIVTIYDNSSENELLLKIQQLENGIAKKDSELDELRQKFSTKEDEITTKEREFSTITTENENIFHYKMSKKDEELDELRRTLDEHLAKPPVEVVVEKETTDNSSKSKLDALQNTLAKVRQETLEKDKKIKELEQTIQEIQKFQENKQAVYLKGSNLDDKLYK
jgi:chromosome segregation ATPase